MVSASPAPEHGSSPAAAVQVARTPSPNACKFSKRGAAAPAAESSSLEALETSAPPPSCVINHKRFGTNEWDTCVPASPAEQRWRHSGWAVDRIRVYKALMRTGTPQNRIVRFAECGGNVWLAIDSAGQMCAQAQKCRDRWCRPCQAERRQALIAAITHRVDQHAARTRFITLTLRGRSDATLPDQLERITTCFATLRRRVWWRGVVDGGCLFIEIKRGQGSRQWHVHLHVLASGSFVDQKQLSSEWLAVTGDSHIVDVRSISDAAKRAAYVVKYVTKPASADVMAVPADLDVAMLAMKGKRMLQTFGDWKGIDAEDAEPPTPRKMLGRLEDIQARAAAGDLDARMWWDMACAKWPHLTADRIDRSHAPLPAVPDA